MGVVSGLLGGLAWLAVFGVLLLIVPKFEEMFARFEIKAGLPWVTQALITISHALHIAWPLVACIVLGVPAAAILVSIYGRSSKGAVAAVVFGLGSLVILFVAMPVIVAGLFLPLVELLKFASGKS
jgi:type II secretory pathway component PulF